MGSGRRAGQTSLGVSGHDREKRGNRLAESGLLWIEAAFLVPIMFAIVFGTAEVGNFFVQRGSMTNVAQSLAMAIQQKPDITAQELYEFQKSLGGGATPFFEVKKSDGSPYVDPTVKCSASDCRIAGLEVKIDSEPSPVTSNTVSAVTHSDWSSPHVEKLAGRRNSEWPHSSSPWKTDPNQDASDDGNPYYVGVRVSWKNRPLLQSLGFAEVTTSQFAGVLVKPVQLPSSPTYGDPVRLKRTPPFDSSPGRGWDDWNNMINHVLVYYMTNQSEASKQYWKDRCHSINGAVPKSLSDKDFIAFEYCGRWACLYENGGVTMPFLARNLDTCPDGGPSDCNNSKFYISWACLYDTLLP